MQKIIHQVYFGTPPPSMVRYMDGVRAMNPEWEYRLWGKENVEQLGWQYDRLLALYKAPVHVSDFVRLMAVHTFGGMYLDSDVEAVQPLDALLPMDAVAAFQDGTGQICPAIFGAAANHPWINWQIINALSFSRPDSPWNVDLMTQAPRYGLTIVPTDWFYPWLWTTPPAERINTPNTLLVHHWKGTWAPWFKREYPT